VFAAVVLCTTVVAFPLLLDRDVGAMKQIHASVRAVLANPIPMAGMGPDRRGAADRRLVAGICRPGGGAGRSSATRMASLRKVIVPEPSARNPV